jgi:acyl dehydratase
MTDAAPHRVRSDAKAPSRLYLEDFAVGQVYEAGPIPVSAGAIKAYARLFDPQPFHTDEELARSTFFQGLVASGWHTASLTMSLVVQALPIAGGVIGGGVDELRWPKPLRPGDELRLEGEIVEVRPSRTKPNQGLVRVRTTTLNQEGQAVQTMIANLVVPRRPMERA